jgi:exopolysaccharide biosynthesis polyprenyl glycosylphosphotransferase
MLAVGDAASAWVGAAATMALWAAVSSDFTPTPGLPLWQVAGALAWTVALRAFGGGELTSRFGRRSVSAVGQALVGVVLLVLALFYVWPFFAPRSSTLLSLPASALAILVWRVAYTRLVAADVFDRRVAVFGVDQAARRAVRAIIDANGALGLRVVAFLDPTGEHSEIEGVPVTHIDENDLWLKVRSLGVDELIVGRTGSLPEALLASLVECFEHGVSAIPATAMYEELTGRVMVSALETDWYAQLPTRGRAVYGAVKRVAEIAIVIATSPLTLVLSALVAVAILVDSGRPVLFKQRRVGRRGETFVLHKFRSMRIDAEADGTPAWATEHDTRVTRLGRWLRVSRLDELPQLWDVLRGQMSLIGPRPERPEFVDRLARELPLYRARALVRPGLTGWAQVCYPYAGSVETSLAKLEYDLFYVRHYGLALDASITLRTIAVMLGLKGR